MILSVLVVLLSENILVKLFDFELRTKNRQTVKNIHAVQLWKFRVAEELNKKVGTNKTVVDEVLISPNYCNESKFILQLNFVRNVK